MCWGDGFVTDNATIAADGLSDPNPFFTSLLAKPYLNNVVISPHYYPPSVSDQTNGCACQVWPLPLTSGGSPSLSCLPAAALALLCIACMHACLPASFSDAQHLNRPASSAAPQNLPDCMLRACMHLA